MSAPIQLDGPHITRRALKRAKVVHAMFWVVLCTNAAGVWLVLSHLPELTAWVETITAR